MKNRFIMKSQGERMPALVMEFPGATQWAEPVTARLLYWILFLGLTLGSPLLAQDLELLIKGGHVIDPKNGVNQVMDLGVSGGKVTVVSPDIPPSAAKRVIFAQGLYVVPGLIDMHVHVFHGTDLDSEYANGPNALPPDGFTFPNGVTTVVDTGGAGWRNFPLFKKQVIDTSQTRVLAFLNIVGHGMRGDPYEQDLGDMNAVLTASRVKEHPGVLVGVKLAHFAGPEWDPVERAVEAGQLADVPVMVDFGRHKPELSLEDLLLKHLRPGDIFTHLYALVPGRLPVVDPQGALRPYVRQARDRGIIFDLGHGAGSFDYSQAVPATTQGFLPDVISTDLHRNSMNAGMKTMLNVLSKMLNLGMTFEQVIEASTWKPAQVIRRPDLGHLGRGAVADIAVLRLHEGDFGFLDASGKRASGRIKVENELTVREAVVVWDLNGIAADDWREE
jgi:dihydroorotase